MNGLRALLALSALLCAAETIAGTYAAPNPSTGEHTVSWNPVTDPYYFVRFDLHEVVGGVNTIVYSGSATSRTLAGRAPGTYTYLVDICNQYNFPDAPPVILCFPETNPATGSAWQVVVTVATPPPVPPVIVGPTGDPDGTYALSWGLSVGASSYELQESVNGGSWATLQNTAATSANIAGRAEGSYAYRVRACAQVCSAWTPTHTVVVLALPGVPGNITGPDTDADGTFAIAWTASTGTVASYRLEERVTSGGIFSQIQSSLALGKSFTGKVNNTYEYRVKACNAAGCSAYTAVKTVQVTGNAGDVSAANPPPNPIVASIPPPSTSSDAVGVLPAQFRVDESGAATYSVPIFTVPGSGGVAPHVSLNYSSQAGNGIAGIGWRVSGTSAITRCRQTKETDNVPGKAVTFTGNDRFCLDGQRLVLVSGTYGANNATYRTEIDSIAKIISYGSQGGGPSYFKVWRKDGSVSEYGNTTDSKIEAFGTNTAVFAWAQNKFTDTATNYISYQYVEDATNGVEFVLDKILYTGNSTAGTSPYAELRFIYDSTRPDKSRGYFAGMAQKQSKRLTQVESWYGATRLRSYTFDYETAPSSNVSRLTSITLCGPTVCLEPTLFTWQDAGGGFASTPSSNPYTKFFNGGKPADIDGDGDADLVWLRVNNSGNKTIEIMRSAGGQYINQGFFVYADNSDSKAWQIMDYNNDGKADVLFPSSGMWSVMLGQTDGSGNPSFGTPISTGVPSYDFKTLAVADFNGDGLADFIYTSAGQLYVRFLIKTDGAYAFGAAQLIVHNFCAPGIDTCSETFSLNSVRPIVADFNGDGYVDLLLNIFKNGVRYWRIYLATVSGSTISLAYFAQLDLDVTNANPFVTFGDWNGDGLTDVAYAQGAAATSWYYRTNTGTQLAAPLFIATLTSAWERANFVDYNGDGRQDFLYTSGGYWSVRLATETGLASATATGLPYNTTGNPQNFVAYFHDVNGDGRPDASRFFLSDNETYAYVWLGKDAFVPANVVTSIENGFGAVTEIEYQAFTDPARAANYYTKSTDGRLATWGNATPVIDLFAPIYAVKRVASTAPAAGSYPDTVDTGALSAISYRYAGAKMQGGGRGFLGFASLTTVDEQTGVETTTSYLQNFPYIALPAGTTVKTTGGQTLASAANTWLDKTAGSGTFRQPYLSQAVENSYDLETAALLTTVTTTTTVDTYGNALAVNVGTTGNGLTVGKSTTNTYTDDVTNWKLGRLTQAVVVHSRTGETNVTRTASFHYATGSKILDQEITEPAGPQAEKLTTTYTLDAFGNRRVATVNGWDGTAVVNRTTTLTFDSLGRFPNQSRNAYNQLTDNVLYRNLYGSPTLVQNIDEVPTDIAYGDLGAEYFRRDPTGAFVQIDSALCNQVYGCPDSAHYRTRKTVAGGGRADVYFDVLGREVRTATVGFDGAEVYVDTEYDNVGRVVRKSEPYFAGHPSYWSEFSYDILGRVTHIEHPDFATSSNQTTTDYVGFVTTITNGKGQTKTETRNAVGELTTVVDELGNSVSYSYDATGNLKSSTQHALDSGINAVTTLMHDHLGRKTSLTDADMGAWTYGYNAFGELIQQTTGISGKYTTVGYDLLGRMTSRSDFSGGVQESSAVWIYDIGGILAHALGKVVQEDNTIGATAGVTRAFTYDEFGRGGSVTTTISGNSYTARTTYDQFGRPFQVFDGADPGSRLHLRCARQSDGQDRCAA